MGYQALLFCPDEKLASVVNQVFNELDFTVEAVHEPFAAVKKLMTQHYDAIVVDSENDQNASLLFKSARNSSSNQGSLAIALVEGQMGVAKAYRIGANLVLTKPINVEQAKGTLRVARGLLRKNSDSAASAGSTAPPTIPARTAAPSAGSSSAGSLSQSANRGAAAMAPPSNRPAVDEIEAPLAAMIPESMPVESGEFPGELQGGSPEMTASAKVEGKPAIVPAPAAQIPITIAAAPEVEGQQPNQAATSTAAPVPTPNTSSPFTSVAGSGAAPAPARELTAFSAKKNKIVELEPAKIVHDTAHDAAPIPVPTFSSASAGNAPSFAALEVDDSGGSGANKKILIGAVAVLALAALGYFGYTALGTSSRNTAVPHPVSASQDSGQTAPAVRPMSSPVAAPSKPTPDSVSVATPTLTSKTSAAVPSGNPSTGTANSPVIRIAASIPANIPANSPANSAANIATNFEPEAKTANSAAMVVKSNTARAKTQAQPEESAPPLPSPPVVASANDNNLSGLMSSASSNIPMPALTTLRISQGVSQGLLIKRVTPKYPPAALALHASGAVQIEATIDKEGNVTNSKVLSGDPVLAQAALEAVRQWRYKPYYLDGAPVEIQTQITVNFKAN